MTDVQVQGFMLAKRPPVVGDVDHFTYGEETSRKGKLYTRIRRNGPEYDGEPFKVLAVEPTGGEPDKHGNEGYSVTLAATTEDSFIQGASPVAVKTTNVGGNQREENIAQAGAYNAAVELVVNGKVPMSDDGDPRTAIEEWHGKLLPFRRSIVGLPPAAPDPTPAPTPEPEQAQTTTDDDIPF